MLFYVSQQIAYIFPFFLFVVHNDSQRAGKHEAQEARKSLTENLPFFLLIFSPFVFTLLQDLINYQHFGSDEAKNSCITFIVCCPIASLSLSLRAKITSWRKQTRKQRKMGSN